MLRARTRTGRWISRIAIFRLYRQCWHVNPHKWFQCSALVGGEIVFSRLGTATIRVCTSTFPTRFFVQSRINSTANRSECFLHTQFFSQIQMSNDGLYSGEPPGSSSNTSTMLPTKPWTKFTHCRTNCKHTPAIKNFVAAFAIDGCLILLQKPRIGDRFVDASGTGKFKR